MTHGPGWLTLQTLGRKIRKSVQRGELSGWGRTEMIDVAEIVQDSVQIERRSFDSPWPISSPRLGSDHIRRGRKALVRTAGCSL